MITAALTSSIIKAYLTKNSVDAVALPALIGSVHDTLKRLTGLEVQVSVTVSETALEKPDSEAIPKLRVAE